jgi:hypothetical protein
MCVFSARNNVEIQVLVAVVMKSSIFWDITPCRLLKVNGRFGGTCRLHLQGRRISKARNQRETGCTTLKLESTCSFEMSVDFQRAARLYIPEDRTLQYCRSWRRNFVVIRYVPGTGNTAVKWNIKL